MVPLTLFTCCTPLRVLGLLTAGEFWLCRPWLWIRIGPRSSAEVGTHAVPGVAAALALACGAMTNPQSVAAAMVSVSSRTLTAMPANELPAR